MDNEALRTNQQIYKNFQIANEKHENKLKSEKKKIKNAVAYDNENTQRRVWELILYDKTVIDTLKSEFTAGYIRSYIGICHDQDVKDDGEQGKLHYHVFVSFIVPKRKCEVMKKYNLTAVQVNSIKHKIESAEEYLLHINNPEKFQYSSEDLFGDQKWIDEVYYTVSKERVEYGINTIIDYVYRCRSPTYNNVLQFVLNNRLFDIYKKNYQIIKDVIRPIIDQYEELKKSEVFNQ